jgi:hypothetical protein
MNPYLHLVVWLSLCLSAPVIAIYAGKLKKRGQNNAADSWLVFALFLLVMFVLYLPLVSWLTRFQA